MQKYQLIRNLFMAAIFLNLIIFSIISCGKEGNKPQEESIVIKKEEQRVDIKKEVSDAKEKVVSKYLQALANKDKTLMQSIIPKTHLAEKEINSKINKFTGKEIKVDKIDYSAPINPQFVIVNIQGFYFENNKKVNFEDQIDLQNIDGRWYLIMGKHKDGIK